MGADEIRTAIREAVAKVARINPETVRDRASFRDDLGLDSLAILETLVEVQCRFQIPDVPDEEFADIRTLEDAVRFVQGHLSSAGVA